MAKSHNTITVAERWIARYEDILDVDFKATTMREYTAAILDYLKNKYPNEFNDYINSSEFIMLMDVVLWLAQNVAFRVDLNARENFLDTAERRASLIRLARNLGYRASRPRGTSGLAKIHSISTTEHILDSRGNDLAGMTVTWNDSRDRNWKEKFDLILNSALMTRTRIGNPVSSVTTGKITRSQYVLNSPFPADEQAAFATRTAGSLTNYMFLNGKLNENGGIDELSPLPGRRMSIFYQSDGEGYGSAGTGFFVPFIQGTRSNLDITIDNPTRMFEATIPASSVDETGIFVQTVSGGSITTEWTRVDDLFAEGIAFSPDTQDRNVFEVDTTPANGAIIRFGDGSFGNIPSGTIRIWYRTVDPVPAPLTEREFGSQTFTIPYESNGEIHNLTMTFRLTEPATGGSPADSNDELRKRARSVYSAQNRIVTAADYNNFLLNDNRIAKVSVVNRTFSGQSRFSDVKDPTSLYQTVRQYFDDARVFMDETVQTTDIGNPSASYIIETVIPSILSKPDKTTTYLVNYPPMDVTGSNYEWTPTASDGSYERGNITSSGNIIPMTGDLARIGKGSLMRLSDRSVYIIDMEGDGSASGSIRINDTIGESARILAFLIPMRTNFTDTEKAAILSMLDNRIPFGLSWDHENDKWIVITGNNIGTGDFSLENQGDTSGMNLDDSWMIRMEFSHSSNSWTIHERSTTEAVQSSSQMVFSFYGDEDMRDPKTGERVRDRIDILECNETRNSPARTGVTFDVIGIPRTESFVANGTDTEFRIPSSGDSASNINVIVNGRLMAGRGYDYKIVTRGTSRYIQFVEAPEKDSNISITYGNNIITSSPTKTTYQAVGDWEYAISGNVIPGNAVPILRNGTFDPDDRFGIASRGTETFLFFNRQLSAPTEIILFTMTETGDRIFSDTITIMDGTTTQIAFNGTFDQSDILVFVNGKIAYGCAVVAGASTTTVVLPELYPAGTVVRIVRPETPASARSFHAEFTADGIATTFTIFDRDIPDPQDFARISIVSRDGEPIPEFDYSFSGKDIVFNNPPVAGSKFVVHAIIEWTGNRCGTSGDTTESTRKEYLDREMSYHPLATLYNPDGTPDYTGLKVTPADLDNDGFMDNPLIFQDFVNPAIDFVIWKTVTVNGNPVRIPLDESTTPRGFVNKGISIGDPGTDGDVHFDSTTGTFLEVVNGTYQPATSELTWKIGRSGVKARWIHYSPESRSIEPAKSNIMDAYVLTWSYRNAIETWKKNGFAGDMPEGESPESLRYTFSSFAGYIPTSDELLWHPVSFRPIFGQGDMVEPEMRATLEISHTESSTLTDTELVARAIESIDNYLSIDNMELGATITTSRIIARLHVDLQPHLQSARFIGSNGQPFVETIRMLDSELPVVALKPSDVVIV